MVELRTTLTSEFIMGHQALKYCAMYFMHSFCYLYVFKKSQIMNPDWLKWMKYIQIAEPRRKFTDVKS